MLLPLDKAALSEEEILQRAINLGLVVDEEGQLLFLKSLDSIDLQAAPGCGKTTLTALKLCLMASGWTSTTSGVCVLSHTNTAKNQILELLQADPDGSRFLSYPHYIGTIQGFIDTFIAFPYLRSNECDIRAVDDSFYEAVAKSELNKDIYPQLKSLSYTRTDILPLVVTSHYVWEEETLKVKGNLNGVLTPFPFQNTAASSQQYTALKESLFQRGIFRFADMYALAQKSLSEHPILANALRTRFPFILIDEMQDTSSLQESVLNQIFASEECVVQRIGDVNQRIYSEDVDDELTAAFPSQGYSSLPKSIRFGGSIADAASRLTMIVPQTIIGNEERKSLPPRIILFDKATIGKVLDVFAQEVWEEVPASELARYPVKAIGARKQSQANQFPRMIGCYFPGYQPIAGKTGRPLTLIDSIALVQLGRNGQIKIQKPDILWSALCDLLTRWGVKFGGRNPTPSRLKANLQEQDTHHVLQLRICLLKFCQVDLHDQLTWNSLTTELLSMLRFL